MRIRTMLGSVVTALIILLCQPSLATTEQVCLIAAPDTAVLAAHALDHDNTDAAAITTERLSASDGLRCGSTPFGAYSHSQMPADESPGGATPATAAAHGDAWRMTIGERLWPG